MLRPNSIIDVVTCFDQAQTIRSQNLKHQRLILTTLTPIKVRLVDIQGTRRQDPIDIQARENCLGKRMSHMPRHLGTVSNTPYQIQAGVPYLMTKQLVNNANDLLRQQILPIVEIILHRLPRLQVPTVHLRVHDLATSAFPSCPLLPPTSSHPHRATYLQSPHRLKQREKRILDELPSLELYTL